MVIFLNYLQRKAFYRNLDSFYWDCIAKKLKKHDQNKLNVWMIPDI